MPQPITIHDPASAYDFNSLEDAWMRMFGTHSRDKQNNRQASGNRLPLPGFLLALIVTLGGAACSTQDEAIDAQVSGPTVELAAVNAVTKTRRAPTFKIREITTENAFLSLEESQLRRAEYTDGVDVPVMSEPIYAKIHVVLDDNIAAAQLKVDLQPALQRGHWLMFFIDDKPAGAAIPVKKAELALPELTVGEHLLRVDILDETLMVLQSSRPHIIYVEDNLAQPLAAN